MKKKLVNGEDAYYYVGYLAGDYLDEAVNTERSDFDFSDGPLFGDTREPEIVETAVGYIRAYLSDELTKVADEKKTQIDMLVKTKRPQYRLLLNRHPEVYDRIPAGLPEDKLDLELYKQQQQWEFDTAKKKHDIEEKVKLDATSDPSFQKLFDEYRHELEEFIASTDGRGYYEFNVTNLRPGECRWLCCGMLIRPSDDKIVVHYQIHSKYSSGELNDTIEMKIS